MKLPFINILFFLAISTINCSDSATNNQKTEELEKRLEDIERENRKLRAKLEKPYELPKEPLVYKPKTEPKAKRSTKKYAFVDLTIKAPITKYNTSGMIDYHTWEYHRYTSDIQTYNHISEEIKYRLMDQARSSVNIELTLFTTNYRGDENWQAEITDIECRVFNSYKAASDAKNKR